MHPHLPIDVDSEANSSQTSAEDLSVEAQTKNRDVPKFTLSDELATIAEASEKDEQLTEHRKESALWNRKSVAKIFTTESSIELGNQTKTNADFTETNNNTGQNALHATLNDGVRSQ